MSIFIHTSKGDFPLGGVPRGLLDDVAQARQNINALQASVDALNASIAQKQEQITALQAMDSELTRQMALKLNADRITQSASVTEAGWALDARELNAAVNGSLSNRIAGNAADIRRLEGSAREIDGGCNIWLSDDGNDETGNPYYKTVEGSRRVWERYRKVAFHISGNGATFSNAKIYNKVITVGLNSGGNAGEMKFGGNRFGNCSILFYGRGLHVTKLSEYEGNLSIFFGGYYGFSGTLDDDMFGTDSFAGQLTPGNVSITSYRGGALTGDKYIFGSIFYSNPVIVYKKNSDLPPERIVRDHTMTQIGTSNIYIA